MSNIVIVSGGFDPLHYGHIRYLTAARELGDELIVGLNSDEWLRNKKGNYFLPWHERYYIMANLRMVDRVYEFNDSDGTALCLLSYVRLHRPFDHLIVANGGDRTAQNNAEFPFQDDNIEFVFGVGGEYKTNSSSEILKRWKDLP